MPKIGIRGELNRKVDAVIEIARDFQKAGYDSRIIQKTLINPLIQAVEIRMEYGVDTPKEEKNDNTGNR